LGRLLLAEHRLPQILETLLHLIEQTAILPAEKAS
jgi:hypothetical protein